MNGLREAPYSRSTAESIRQAKYYLFLDDRINLLSNLGEARRWLHNSLNYLNSTDDLTDKDCFLSYKYLMDVDFEMTHLYKLDLEVRKRYLHQAVGFGNEALNYAEKLGNNEILAQMKLEKAKHALRGLELDLKMSEPPLDVSLRRDGVLMLIEEARDELQSVHKGFESQRSEETIEYWRKRAQKCILPER